MQDVTYVYLGFNLTGSCPGPFSTPPGANTPAYVVQYVRGMCIGNNTCSLSLGGQGVGPDFAQCPGCSGRVGFAATITCSLAPNKPPLPPPPPVKSPLPPQPPTPPQPPFPPPQPGAANIALNASVWSSSSSSAWPYEPHSPMLVTNGAPWSSPLGCAAPRAAFAAGNVAITADSDMWPWITIDLGRPSRVFSVTLWNRADCCQDQLPLYRIFAGNISLPTPSTQLFGPVLGNPTCAAGSPPAAWSSGASPTFTATCGAVARYVTIQRTDGKGLINLCQVQITGASS